MKEEDISDKEETMGLSQMMKKLEPKNENVGWTNLSGFEINE